MLKVEQVDAAGNLSAQVSKPITVDTSVLSAPVLAAASDTGVKGDNITYSGSPTLTGQAAANATVEVWDTFNGSSVRVGTAAANASGAWSLTLSAQAQGDHSYVVKELGSDGLPAAGRTSTSALALTIDTTAPSAALAFTVDTTAPAAPTPAWR